MDKNISPDSKSNQLAELLNENMEKSGAQINGRHCYLSATRSRKRNEEPELLVIISFNRNEQSFLNYRERWQAETLFKSMKSSGFNIENTHLRDIRRMEKLLFL